MKGLDTNVLVRYMVQDDQEQSRLATRFIETACSRDAPGFIAQVVLCELVWVLDAGYGHSRSTIADTLQQVMRVAQFRVEDPQTVWRALHDYRAGGADFADCLIGWINHRCGCEYTVSFDKAASRIRNFKLLR